MNIRAALRATRAVLVLLLICFIVISSFMLIPDQILAVIAITLLALGAVGGIWFVFYQDYDEEDNF